MSAKQTIEGEGSDKKRATSPRFPSTSLSKSLENLGKIYGKERRTPTPREAAVKHLGYSSISGASAPVLGSLAHFGLVEECGQGRLRVTALGEAILLPKSEGERTESLIQALHHPKMFSTLLQRYGVGHLPSDETMRIDLIRDFGFTEAAAQSFIRSFRTSIEFANPTSNPFELKDSIRELDESYEVVAPTRPDKEQSSSLGHNTVVNSVAHSAKIQSIDGPLSQRTKAELHIDGPLGPEELKRLKVWIERIALPWAEFRTFMDEEQD